MKKAIIILSFCIIAIFLQAQNVDSLVNKLTTENHPPAQKIELYKEISDIYLDNDIEKSILYAKAGIIIAEKENDLLNESKLYQSLSIAYQAKASFDTAYIYMEKAMKAALESNVKIRETNVLFGLGTLYMDQEKYHPAIEYYMKSLKLSDEIGYLSLHSSIFLNLSLIHRKMKNKERFIFYLNKAKEFAEKEKNNNIKMHIYQAFGNYHGDNKDFDKALSYNQQAYDISVFLNNKSSQALLLCSIALLNGKFKDYDKGLQNVSEALRISQELGSKTQIVTCYNVLSNIYREKQMYKESEEMALKGWELDSTSVQEATNFALNLTISNIHLQDKDKAVDYFWKYYHLKDQFSEESFKNTLLEMEVKYETEKKEMHIASLEKENLLYFWIGSIIVILLLFAFISLSYHHRLMLQKRRVAEQQNELADQKIKQLEQEKLLIATQAVLDGEVAERSRLAKDFHNRLGGLLTVIKYNLKEIGSYSSLEKQDISRFDKALEMLDLSVAELRRIAHHLMPDSLMRYGLRVAIEDFCNAINIANFKYYGSDKRPEERLEIILYHSAYELVNNAIKHSEATAINIQLLIDNGLASLTVQDNGIGFDVDKITSGTGLDNIRTHILAYNGKMNIHSSPGNGTEISIEIENIKSNVSYI